MLISIGILTLSKKFINILKGAELQYPFFYP